MSYPYPPGYNAYPPQGFASTPSVNCFLEKMAKLQTQFATLQVEVTSLKAQVAALQGHPGGLLLIIQPLPNFGAQAVHRY